MWTSLSSQMVFIVQHLRVPVMVNIHSKQKQQSSYSVKGKRTKSLKFLQTRHQHYTKKSEKQQLMINVHCTGTNQIHDFVVNTKTC